MKYKTRKYDKRLMRGFTLIEIMIVVAIISILAAIALPSYQDSVRKSRRSDAKIALERAAAAQEQQYFNNNTYTADVNNLGGSSGTLNSPEGFYEITATVTADDITGCSTDNLCYQLTATAIGVQADDTGCATLSLTNTGVKASSSNTTGCW